MKHGRPIAVVISQPMLFPWIGMLEQIRLADKYVHYGDVQFSKGSFVNRVQVKTRQGRNWLTVPLRDLSIGQHIDAVKIDDRKAWRNQHLELLKQAYATAPYRDEMLDLVRGVYQQSYETIGAVSRASLLALCGYFDLRSDRQFFESHVLEIGGESSQRVLDIVAKLQGTRYITGWGARNYLDHELFERHGITVEYMDYLRAPYPQLHGDFTPYVSALDLVANCGMAGREHIRSATLYWKEFISHG
ncbi:MAG TPA: WbqC family protein [Dongiaceae bacterium]|nr:WbqC family protein [Dongiaceae bacterium]